MSRAPHGHFLWLLLTLSTVYYYELFIKVWLPVFAHLVSYRYSRYLHQNTQYHISLVFTGIAHHYCSFCPTLQNENHKYCLCNWLCIKPKPICYTRFLPSFTYKLWIIATTIGVYTSVINALLPRLVILIVYPSVGHWLSIPSSCFASFLPSLPAYLSPYCCPYSCVTVHCTSLC